MNEVCSRNESVNCEEWFHSQACGSREECSAVQTARNTLKKERKKVGGKDSTTRKQ